VSLLGKIQAAVGKVQGNQELNEVRFRHTGTWSDGTTCRFSVQDPNPHGRWSTPRAAPDRHARRADVRVLRVHPQDLPPGEGAALAWDGGTVTLVSWSQVSDFTGQAVGVCRFTR